MGLGMGGKGMVKLGDHRPLQLLVLPGRRGSHHDTDDRLQRGAGHVQEPQVPGVGPRRADLHPAVLAVLLLEHGRGHLRG